jgi:hypothetical protein
MRPAEEWAVVLAGTLWSLPTLPDHAKQYLTTDLGEALVTSPVRAH